MPQRRGLADQTGKPWLDGHLRDNAWRIADQASRDIEPVLRAHWDLREDELRDGVRLYVEALIDSLERQSFDPVETYLSSLDSMWQADRFRIDPLIQALFIVGDVTRQYLPERCRPDAERLVDQFTRKAIQFLSHRSVSVITNRLEEQVQRHREGEARLMSLQRIGSALVSDLDLERSLNLISDEALGLIGADGVIIRILSEDGLLDTISDSGDGTQMLLTRRLSTEDSLSGVALKMRRPVRVDDVRTDERVNQEYLNHSGGRSLLIVPLVARDQPIGVITGTSSRVAAFDEQDEALMTLFADQAASAYQNGRLYQQAQNQIGELESLHRVSQLVSSSLDLDEIFQTLYEEVARLMPADVLMVALARPDGLYDLEFIVDDGQRFPPRRGVELSPMLSEGLNKQQTVVVRDIANHRHYPKATRFGNLERESRSLLAAPLMRGEQVIGLISAQSYEEHDYRDPEARMLRTIASQAAVAIEHARLYRQAQNVAIAEERARLAREIHDTLAQGLIGVILCLERLDLAVSQENEDERPWLERALDLSRSSLEEARRSVRDLRAAPLEGRTLLEAVANLIADINENSRFEVSATLPPTIPPLSARVETALFRVVQEAISNAYKHSRCDKLFLSLASDGDSLRLTISDNGVGFDPASRAPSTEHYGLTTMRERVTQIGGEFEITSVEGDGTCIEVSLPMELAVYQETRDPERTGYDQY